eukprot:g3914.t1
MVLNTLLCTTLAMETLAMVLARLRVPTSMVLPHGRAHPPLAGEGVYSAIMQRATEGDTPGPLAGTVGLLPTLDDGTVDIPRDLRVTWAHDPETLEVMLSTGPMRRMHSDVRKQAAALVTLASDDYPEWRRSVIEMCDDNAIPHLLNFVGQRAPTGEVCTFAPTAYAVNTLARKYDARLYALLSLAYGTAAPCRIDARRAAEAVVPHSGHLFVETLDFHRALYTENDIAEWRAIQNDVALENGDIWAYVRDVREVRTFLVLRSVKPQDTEFITRFAPDGIPAEDYSTFCDYCKRAGFVKLWAATAPGEQLSPGRLRMLKRIYQHTEKECKYKKHPELYCKVCGGASASEKTGLPVHSRRVSDSDDGSANTYSTDSNDFVMMLRVGAVRNRDPRDRVVGKPEAPKGCIVLHLDSGCSKTILNKSAVAALGRTYQPPASGCTRTVTSFDGSVTTISAQTLDVHMEPADTSFIRSQNRVVVHNGREVPVAINRKGDPWAHNTAFASWAESALICPNSEFNLCSVEDLRQHGFTVSFSPHAVTLGMTWKDTSTPRPSYITTVLDLPTDPVSKMPYITMRLVPANRARKLSLKACAGATPVFASPATTGAADDETAIEKRVRFVQQQEAEDRARIEAIRAAVDEYGHRDGHNLASAAVAKVMASAHSPKITKAKEYERAHVRFGHFNTRILDAFLRRLGLVDPKQTMSKLHGRVKDCIACNTNYARRAPARKQGHHEPAEQFGTATSFDLKGPISPPGPSGERWQLLFVDRHLGWLTGVCLRTKAEAVDAIIKYHNDVIAPAKPQHKRFETDKDACWSEHASEFTEFCRENQIEVRYAGTARPHEIPFVERSHATVNDRVRMSLEQANLPGSLWPLAYRDANEFELWDPETCKIIKTAHVKIVEARIDGPGLTCDYQPMQLLAAARGSKKFAGKIQYLLQLVEDHVEDVCTDNLLLGPADYGRVAAEAGKQKRSLAYRRPRHRDFQSDADYDAELERRTSAAGGERISSGELRLDYRTKRDHDGKRARDSDGVIEQFVALPRSANVTAISRAFHVNPDTYLEFLRTYDTFSPTGAWFAKNLRYPVYTAGTEVPIPHGHPDFETLRSPSGPNNAAQLLDEQHANQARTNAAVFNTPWTEQSLRPKRTASSADLSMHEKIATAPEARKAKKPCRTRELPKEAWDPKHSYKCNPDQPASTIFEPNSLREAKQCLDASLWADAIKAEQDNIVSKGSLQIVVVPPGTKLIDTTWVFKNKVDPVTGRLDKMKARITVRGFKQEYGSEYIATEAPTMASTAVRIMFCRAAQLRAAGATTVDIFSADVSGAFTYGEFEEGVAVYIANPEGFDIPLAANEAYRLNRVIYGCRQGANRFFVELKEFLQGVGFTQSTADPCLFVSDDGSMLLGTHVDDIAVLGTPKQYAWFCAKLKERFKATFDGPIRRLLGMAVERPSPTSYLLHQAVASDAAGNTYSDTVHVFNLLSRQHNETIAYSDSDWGADTDDRRSYESSVIKQCGAAVMWRCSKAKLHNVDIGAFNFLYVPSADNDADINTKALPAEPFRMLTNS